MGSFVYGYVTAQRAVAPPGESQATAAPAMTTYIDTLAALVPAEALALYAGVVVPNVTRAVPVTGKTGTVISDPALLDWSCAGLMVLSAGLYIVGRMKEKHDLSLWDIPRALIPLAAFTAWMLVQSPGVFDVWWPGSSMAGRVIIAAFTTIVLGALAKALGYQADQAGPPAAGQPAAEVPAGRRTHNKMIARAAHHPVAVSPAIGPPCAGSPWRVPARPPPRAPYALEPGRIHAFRTRAGPTRKNQDHSPERLWCVPQAPTPRPPAARPDG